MLMRPPSTAKHQSLSGRTGQTLNQQGLLAASNVYSWAVSRQMGCSFKGACSYVDAASIYCKTPVMKRADGLGPESARLLTASKKYSWAVSRQKGRSFKGACSYVDAAPIHCKTHQSFSGRTGQTLNRQGLLTASNGYSWAVSRYKGCSPRLHAPVLMRPPSTAITYGYKGAHQAADPYSRHQ